MAKAIRLSRRWRFFDFVEGRKTPKLPDLRFAVPPVGDSTCQRFCEAGKRLDRRLEELGASRIFPRIDCDVDYQDEAAKWSSQVLSLLAQSGDETVAVARPAAAVGNAE